MSLRPTLDEAIEEAAKNDDQAKLNTGMATLLRLNEAVSERRPELENTMRAAADELMRYGCISSSIAYHYDPDTRGFRIIHRGDEQESLREFHNVCRQEVFATQESEILRRPHGDHWHSSIFLPISGYTDQKEPHGVLHMTQNGILDSIDLYVLNQTATYIARAIDLHELSARAEHHKKQAQTDELTGLYNRRAFFDRMAIQMKQSRRRQLPFAIALLDIDKFKDLNDTYGHPCGDQVLREFAARLRSSVRPADVPARYGGEEFIVLLPELQAEDAAERMLHTLDTIRGTTYDVSGHSLPVTSSIGVASYDPAKHYTTPSDIPSLIISEADNHLYKAKNAGRNRICTAADTYGVNHI